jgi:YggT family protein
MFAAYAIARSVVFAAFCVALLAATAAWLVRTRRVSPFGTLGRTLRSLSEPFTAPIERRLVRAGGNPVHAGWWLVIGVAVAGVLLLSLLDWVARTTLELSGATHAGPRALLALVVQLAYEVLVVALVVRVVGTWLGMFRYARWMRPAYALTDWLVGPISRILPPVGMFDWSPLAAWLVLWVLRQLLLSVIA